MFLHDFDRNSPAFLNAILAIPDSALNGPCVKKVALILDVENTLWKICKFTLINVTPGLK